MVLYKLFKGSQVGKLTLVYVNGGLTLNMQLESEPTLLLSFEKSLNASVEIRTFI